MKTSVIVTTYNGEKYIIEQLNSIMTQTQKPDEVLILDDGSTDSTINLVERFILENKLKSWELIKNQVNIGWRRNFMQGAWKAKGDYIFFCDQDDLWGEDKIAYMTSIMEQNKKITLLTSRFIEFDPDGTERLLPEDIEDNTIIQKRVCRQLFVMNYPGCTFCANKVLINESRDVWSEKDPHDALLWRMSMMTDGLYTCGKVLLRRRKHGDNTYDKERDRNKSLQDFIEWLEYADNNMKNLETYVSKKNVQEYKLKTDIIKRTMKWVELRKKFISERRLIPGIKLIRYLDCYLGKRSYLTDWKLYVNPNAKVGSNGTLA